MAGAKDLRHAGFPAVDFYLKVDLWYISGVAGSSAIHPQRLRQRTREAINALY